MHTTVGQCLAECPVLLAPMSGITDLPFRNLVRSLGGALVVSEMVASRELLASREQQRRIERAEGADPHIVQLAGTEPSIMAEAARLAVGSGADVIDINFGCPAKKVVGKAAGSALMRDEALAADIVKAVVSAVPVPVTVKMRLGWDDAHRNAPHLAQLVESAGARMVTVHGRTRSQLFSGAADWRFVGQVKQSVGIPVIVNGDIAGPGDVQRSLTESGADGVMIGRAARGRPWAVGQVRHYLRTGVWQPDPPPETRLSLALQHYDAMLTHYGTHTGVRVARKHLGWYLQGLPGAAAARQSVFAETDPRRVRHLMAAAFAGQPVRHAA